MAFPSNDLNTILDRIREDVTAYDPSSAKRIRSKHRALDHQELVSCIGYSADTGKLTWKQGQFAGNEAGSYVTTRGKHYIRVGFRGERIMAHVLIWFYVYGKWPESEIDHINSNGRDNRLHNLRLSNRMQNNSNTSLRRDSKQHPNILKTKSGKFAVSVKFNSKSYRLGTFDTVEEAIKVKDRAQVLIPRFESHSAEPVAVSVRDKPIVKVPYKHLESDIKLDNITIIDNIEVPPTAETI